jgi:hypothetical protein
MAAANAANGTCWHDGMVIRLKRYLAAYHASQQALGHCDVVLTSDQLDCSLLSSAVQGPADGQAVTVCGGSEGQHTGQRHSMSVRCCCSI